MLGTIYIYIYRHIWVASIMIYLERTSMIFFWDWSRPWGQHETKVLDPASPGPSVACRSPWDDFCGMIFGRTKNPSDFYDWGIVVIPKVIPVDNKDHDYRDWLCHLWVIDLLGIISVDSSYPMDDFDHYLILTSLEWWKQSLGTSTTWEFQMFLRVVDNCNSAR